MPLSRIVWSAVAGSPIVWTYFTVGPEGAMVIFVIIAFIALPWLLANKYRSSGAVWGTVGAIAAFPVAYGLVDHGRSSLGWQAYLNLWRGHDVPLIVSVIFWSGVICICFHAARRLKDRRDGEGEPRQ